VIPVRGPSEVPGTERLRLGDLGEQSLAVELTEMEEELGLAVEVTEMEEELDLAVEEKEMEEELDLAVEEKEMEELDLAVEVTGAPAEPPAR